MFLIREVTETLGIVISYIIVNKVADQYGKNLDRK